MLLRTLLFLVMVTTSIVAYSQSSFWFGPRGGADISFQRWNGSEANSLFTPHLGFFIESYEEESPSSLFANLGYHTRGAAVTYAFFNGGRQRDAYRFNNIVLGLGAKRKLSPTGGVTPFYTLGIRGEYTISTNLSDYESDINAQIHPNDEFVRKFNYGITIGGGFEKRLSDFVEGFIEFAIHPDLSFQYEQPSIPNVPIDNPFSTTDRTTIPERSIRNVSMEITIGIKFLRLVEYEDY